MGNRDIALILGIWLVLVGGCQRGPAPQAAESTTDAPPSITTSPAPASPPLVAAARAQIGRTVLYDPAYVVLGYPGGDVPEDRGVCTDDLRDERHPDDPLIPCTKLRGMWMCKSGGNVGAEYFITDGPRAILLTIDEATEEQKRCIGHVSHTRDA